MRLLLHRAGIRILCALGLLSLYAASTYLDQGTPAVHPFQPVISVHQPLVEAHAFQPTQQ